MENLAAESSASVQFCKCNGICKQKKGKRTEGCPCKNLGQDCSGKCLCGKKKGGIVIKPCANGKVVSAPVEDATEDLDRSDGHVRMAKELENSEKDIKDYLQTLSRDQLEFIIVEVTAQGDGSIDYIRDTLAALDINAEPHDGTLPDWCKCGKCKLMPTLIENKCCGFRKCVTSYRMFEKSCLDKDILTLNIKARADIRAEEWDFSTNSLRKAAYRQFILWKYGKLGRSNRKVNPSCVVLKVRDKYKSADGVYMGYLEN